MMLKTKEDFAAEIAAMQERLQASGKNVEASAQHAEAGIRCDFDLPYSSLPSLAGNRWTNAGLSFG